MKARASKVSASKAKASGAKAAGSRKTATGAGKAAGKGKAGGTGKAARKGSAPGKAKGVRKVSASTKAKAGSDVKASRAAAVRKVGAGRAEPVIFIYGGGKVGRGLQRALRAVGVSAALRPARRGLPRRPIDADLVIVALRDRDIATCAEALRARGLIGHRRCAVVHCAGALGPEALEAVRSERVAVAQMHPMISFASTVSTPGLLRGQLHVDGDAYAVRLCRALGKQLGMSPRTIPGLDRVAYHAAAGIVANGAAALAAGGVGLLERAGVARATAAAMLGPLLRTVADNVEALGLPQALTGPVRRGDATGVARHLETLRRLAPELIPLYEASAAIQLPLARELGEAKDEAFDAVEAALSGAS
ncbi:DUF2520 domain-containing protein [Chondromyces crocatus]|uniref:DUF2520 domain-containing protein n=1 Tax=Chondromyces crocatus TaxID=52 RepID=A0A0K1EFX8_CHOCO|nr:DUF2520 domain-containing protein [Chondromyces crocatus]AKT39776.1 uncharacterized protein CMC5_039270 [Chondromyces crocatus]